MEEKFKVLGKTVITKVKKAPVANIGELEDTLGDVLIIGNVIEKALSDGFQITDAFKALEIQDEVTDVIASFDEFIASFKGLPPQVGMDAIDNAIARAVKETGKLGKISSFVSGLLVDMSTSYANILTVKGLIDVEIAKYKTRFSLLGKKAEEVA